MPLTSMKRTEAEQKGETLLGEPVDASREDYSYGLRINLDEPELQKLGLEDPKVGGEIKLQAIGKLVSFSNDEHGRSATILLTSLGVDTPPEADRTDVLYKQPGTE